MNRNTVTSPKVKQQLSHTRKDMRELLINCLKKSLRFILIFDEKASKNQAKARIYAVLRRFFGTLISENQYSSPVEAPSRTARDHEKGKRSYREKYRIGSRYP